MLVVALVISTLTTRIKRQADAARDRERRTSALYALSRDFASTRDIENILRKAVKHINDVFDSQAVITLPNAGGRLQARGRFAGWWPSYDGKRTIFAPDTGADDYLTKPFSVGELLARMRVALRHAARGGRRSTTRFKRLASCVWIWRGGMC